MNHVRVRGRAEIRALTAQVFTAMQSAELTSELVLLHERVFSREPAALFDTVSMGHESVLTLKPMVELLLLHVRDIASSATSATDREADIRWTIEAAGF